MRGVDFMGSIADFRSASSCPCAGYCGEDSAIGDLLRFESAFRQQRPIPATSVVQSWHLDGLGIVIPSSADSVAFLPARPAHDLDTSSLPSHRGPRTHQHRVHVCAWHLLHTALCCFTTPIPAMLLASRPDISSSCRSHTTKPQSVVMHSRAPQLFLSWSHVSCSSTKR